MGALFLNFNKLLPSLELQEKNHKVDKMYMSQLLYVKWGEQDDEFSYII